MSVELSSSPFGSISKTEIFHSRN